jgi:hypothetical protein
MKQYLRRLLPWQLLLLAACLPGCHRGDQSATEEDILQALQEKSDACLRFAALPIDVDQAERGSEEKFPTMRPSMAKALWGIGLMDKSTIKKTHQKLYGGTFEGEVDRYSLSAKAQPYFQPNGQQARIDALNHPQGRLCFARREILKVQKIEPVGKINHFDAVIATYAYRVREELPFSRDEKVRQAFPEILQILQQVGEPGKCRAVLALTNGKWQVMGTPPTVSPCQIDY